MKKKKKGILDGDIIIYQLAGSNETKIDWGDDTVSHMVDLKAAQEGFIEYMDKLFGDLGISEMVIAISDDKNWRKEVNPQYKSNRKDIVRPLLITELRKWVKENYEVLIYPRLEADDVLGVEGTKDSNNTVIVSDDKDMLTLPCHVYVPRQKKHYYLNAYDAWFNTCYQALKGDTVDGYSGAVGIGHKKATEALEACGKDSSLWKVVQDLFYTSFLNRYIKDDFELNGISDIDYHTLSKYKQNKLFKTFKKDYVITEELEEHLKCVSYASALMNLRMANILWLDQFNIDTGKIYLMNEELITKREDYLNDCKY